MKDYASHYVNKLCKLEICLAEPPVTALSVREQYVQSVQPLLAAASSGDILQARRLGRILYESVAGICRNRAMSTKIFDKLV